jgi:glycine/D-amino acid oxidase-like deaminating enzyme
MVRLMSRSIGLMEEQAGLSNNLFTLNRRGYLYVTCDPGGVDTLRASAAEASELGAGQVREHNAASRSYQPHSAEGFAKADGADLLTKPTLIQRHFPYLSPEVTGALHVRRAGWLSGQTYGAWLLEQAQHAGVRLLKGKVIGLDTSTGSVSSVWLEDGSEIQTDSFINAAGPHLAALGRMLGQELPVVNELHLKASFNDHLGVLGRTAPLIICADQQQLAWTRDERALLAEDAASAWLLGTLASGAHTRPEGGPDAQSILVLWDLHNQAVEPIFPISEDPMVAELAVRGLVRILPGMRDYVDHLPRFTVDGGYYTKTVENRPLIGPTMVPGVYLVAGLSGFGVMVSAGAADLLAHHIVGDQLPGYAEAFLLERYDTPGYLAEIERAATGQL